jgi:formylglycine-generating enzyme required for sulfatase activity
MTSLIEVVTIPSGTFLGKDSNQIYVPGFYLSKYLITRKIWNYVTQLPEVNTPLVSTVDIPELYQNPVRGVSYWDVLEFCNRISSKTDQYRLPTEIEWEYACRAGTTTAFYFGGIGDASIEKFNHLDLKLSATSHFQSHNSIHPHQVNRVNYYPPNPWGLHDMHGNLWEWCKNSKENKTEQESDNWPAILKGGSWRSPARSCQSSSIISFPKNYRNTHVGFRVVLERPTQFGAFGF